MQIFESVPNFSEGRRQDVIDVIAAAAATRAHLLDVDADADHNRVVVSVAGNAGSLVDALFTAVEAAIDRIDLRAHEGVHPRVGAADVVPIVPLGDTSLDNCHTVARELGERVWQELRVPVYFYGYGEGRALADIRAGRASTSLGGPALHPTAGAVCIGARLPLVAFNVILYETDLVAARAVARSIRESDAGLRGVQALAFELSGARVQLSMNLFRIEETRPSDVIAELGRRGMSLGAEQVVGLCPAVAATPAADGRVLEARIAAAAARQGALLAREVQSEEHFALADRLEAEADSLHALRAGQDEILAAAERSAALMRVLSAAGVDDLELEAMLRIAAEGFRDAISDATESLYGVRVQAVERSLSSPA
jgi:glutamate formiminotransferase